MSKQEQRKHLRLTIALTSLFNHKVLELYQHQDADNNFSHFSYTYSTYRTQLGLKGLNTKQTDFIENNINKKLSNEENHSILVNHLTKKQSIDPLFKKRIKETLENTQDPKDLHFMHHSSLLSYFNPIFSKIRLACKKQQRAFKV